MRIAKIKVNNFKSLVDFEIDLSKFNCIVGLNGSGKSTFLQFVSFLSQLMKGNIGSWFQKRKWGTEDIVPHFDNKTNRTVHFEIQFQYNSRQGAWSCEYSVDNSRCISEELTLGDDRLEVFSRQGQPGKYTFNDRSEKINFSYQGSILSQLADKDVTEVFGKLVHYFRSIHSFDPLSPYYLKQRSKVSSGSIGLGGEDLAPFVFELKDRRSDVIRKIKTVYPEFNSFGSSIHPDGTKQLTIDEQYRNGDITYTVPARIANDGVLRVIAMLAQMLEKDAFLLFDEIENGINQELVEFLLKELVEAKQQIVVTTHSPMFLNYLDDDLARESVHYFYKTPEGFTRCRKFFSIPSTSKKLGTLGPGEAIADTNLYRLNEEIEKLDYNEKKEN